MLFIYDLILKLKLAINAGKKGLVHIMFIINKRILKLIIFYYEIIDPK
jgi:hypothetical protein